VRVGASNTHSLQLNFLRNENRKRRDKSNIPSSAYAEFRTFGLVLPFAFFLP
jgi:hypothetical protein